jgi:hypothetical protein
MVLLWSSRNGKNLYRIYGRKALKEKQVKTLPPSSCGSRENLGFPGDMKKN